MTATHIFGLIYPEEGEIVDKNWTKNILSLCVTSSRPNPTSNLEESWAGGLLDGRLEGSTRLANQRW